MIYKFKTKYSFKCLCIFNWHYFLGRKK